MGILDFLFGRTVSAREYLFPIDGSYCAVDYSVERFGMLCCAIANAIPEEHRADISYRVAVSRTERTVTVSIDVGARRNVNLRKVMPDYHLAEVYGWQENENYLEGIFRYSYFPDAWDGREIDQCILETLCAEGRQIKIINHYDNVVSGNVFVCFGI